MNMIRVSSDLFSGKGSLWSFSYYRVC